MYATKMLQYFRWLGVTRVTIFTSSAREPEKSKDRGARSKKKIVLTQLFQRTMLINLLAPELFF
jgi:hypothetical protein